MSEIKFIFRGYPIVKVNNNSLFVSLFRNNTVYYRILVIFDSMIIAVALHVIYSCANTETHGHVFRRARCEQTNNK